jgi:hypothetical protein
MESLRGIARDDLDSVDDGPVYCRQRDKDVFAVFHLLVR